MSPNRTRALLPVITAIVSITLLSSPARAHCDGLDGPVVKAAREALASGDVNLALIWVQPQDEPEIRKVFGRTMAVRKLNPEAKELADLHFFETLVRVHRAGEGAPYTGLKPAGRDLGPAIPAADRAIERGSAEELVKMLTEGLANGIRERLQKTQATGNYKSADLRAGREHVKAYVEFLHYAERLYAATRSQEHEGETKKAGEHEH